MNEVKKKSLYSWLLFDLANTVYAFVIPGLYFSVWLVSEQGWTDQALGLATSGAMVIVALTGPWVGARSDATPNPISDPMYPNATPMPEIFPLLFSLLTETSKAS